MEVLNKSLQCPNCDHSLIAYDVDMQSTTPTNNSSQQTFGEQNHDQNQGAFKVDVGSQGHLHTRMSNTKSHEEKSPTVDVSTKSDGKRKRKQVSESSKGRKSVSNTNSKSN